MEIQLLYIIVDHWNRESHPYKKLEYGKWELIIPPNSDGSPVINHLSEIKASYLLNCFVFFVI